MTDIGVAFALGFLGSIHCIGMCGGFALLAGLGSGSSAKRSAGVNLYILGKTTTYTLLGALLAGLVSSLPDSIAVLQKVIMVLTGVFLVLVGLHMTGLGPNWIMRAPNPASAFVSRMSEAVKRSSLTGRFVLGLINGLLPCGLLYGALSYSATMDTATSGAVFMAVFGIGTAPALIFAGLGASLVDATKRQRIYHALGWIVVVMGLATILRVTPLMHLFMSGM